MASTGTNTRASLVAVGSASTPVTDVTIRDLGFVGNGIAQAGQPPNPPVISFGYSSLLAGRCKVLDCNFSANTGYTLGFAGLANADVTGCRFVNVGYFNGVLPPGDSNITPAVFADENCTNIRVHRNYFSLCQFDGVRIRATESEIGCNFFDQCYGSAVNAGDEHAQGSEIRVISNYAQFTHEVGANNQALYIQHLRNSIAIGNIVHCTDGDGIAGGGCSAEVYLGNVVYDNCAAEGTAGDCGIQYIGQTNAQFPNTANFGISFVGNICYDDNETPKQRFGFHIFTNGDALLTAAPMVGNSFWGNVSDLSIDVSFTDDSNVSWTNTTGWNDRHHSTTYNPPNGLTGTILKTSLLSDPLKVGAYSIVGRGVRVTASGATAGGSNKMLYLGFGASGNIMTVTVPGGASNKYWQLVAYVADQSVLSAPPSYLQYGMVQFWCDGSLVYETPAGPLGETTADALQLLLEGQLDAPSDSIFCDFVSVERV